MEAINRHSRSTITALNQLCEIERKLKKHGDPTNLSRNLAKIKDAFEEDGYFYEDPMGQPFKETRTDLDAQIAGQATDNLVVVDVVKPIIRTRVADGFFQIVQKGIVVVEARKEPEGNERND